MQRRTRPMLSVTGMLLAGLAGAAVYAGGDGRVNFGRGRQARARNVILFIGDGMGRVDDRMKATGESTRPGHSGRRVERSRYRFPGYAVVDPADAGDRH